VPVFDILGASALSANLVGSLGVKNTFVPNLYCKSKSNAYE
jgi:hypothetical protein